ncbi:MAG: hypothetical protein KDK62_06355 [Chlamydiia bacterium]|nr:hypothetical protein [Chlamydiia bacterium]
MPKVFRVLFLSAFFATLILAIIYFPELKESLTHEKEAQLKQEAALTEANQLLLLNRPLDALQIVKERRDLIDSETLEGQAWLEVLVKGSEALPDPEQLKEVFYFYPEALKDHEKGALLIAPRLIAEGDDEGYRQLRAFYKNQESDPATWMMLDADSLIISGEPDQAATLLQSRYFEGSEDTPRLIRLALLHLNHHPKVAWDYLEQARKKDPTNLDITLFRARLLESAGKPKLAEKEWDFAKASGALKDPVAKDELVDFYIRNQSYPKALEVLQYDLSYSINDTLLLKALFLSKAIEPLPFSFPTKEESVKGFSASLPEGKFWDAPTAPAVLKPGEALAQEPSALWLRTLENLRVKREADALVLLENDMQNTTFDPAMKAALKSLLKVRLKDESPPEALTAFLNLPFNEPSEVIEYMKGPDAFSTLFLARGWNEAALSLYPNGPHSNAQPEWTKEALAKALRKNRGLKEALAYLALQSDTPGLNWIEANYLLQNHQEEEGIALLQKLADSSGPEARKAALLLAERAFKNGAWEDTKRALSLQPEALNSIKGQTLLARIALMVEDEDEAEKIYESIQDDSMEAKSYLSKRAFEAGDYKKAYQLTEELLKADPDNRTLIENLNYLMQAQKAS